MDTCLSSTSIICRTIERTLIMKETMMLTLILYVLSVDAYPIEGFNNLKLGI